MRIFTGELTSWPRGSTHGPIKVYARDDKSGTFDTFKTLVLSGKPLASGAQRFENSNELSDAVARDPNGIGFIGLPFIRSAKPIAVSEKGTLALLPNRLTVATEDYSLSRRLFLYAPATPANKFTRQFVEFALSKQGQDVVGANGFIAQNVMAENQSVPGDAPDEYRQLTSGAKRMSLNFRFENGALTPDNKAQADLGRVVLMIADMKISGDKVMLLGFADSTGSPQNNLALSVDRARTVASEFNRRGLQPTIVRGFGSSLPVASNDTPDGRDKNRRVEVWIRQ
jgi:phosphate transport system substrate-binding protein